MIKTLRITTIIAAILAVIIFSLPLVFGGRSSEEVENLLSSDNVVEKFKKTEGSQSKTGTSQTSPLVKQAEAFALYLNPPAPKPEPTRKAHQPRVSTPAPRAPVTPKFTLIGTSFYEANPGQSLAFIDEPGKGMRWVKQGSAIGHLTIRQVKDGLIVVQDGQRTSEIVVPEIPQRSLLQGSSATSAAIGSNAVFGPAVTAFDGTDVDTTISAPPEPAIDPNALQRFMESVQAGVESGEIDSPKIEKFLSGLGSVRISDEEAAKLKDLPEQLDSSRLGLAEPKQDVQQDPNQTKGRKVERPTITRRKPLPLRR